MRHLDVNALAQLIGAMADVVGGTTTPPPEPPTGASPALADALATFFGGWQPPTPEASESLADRVDRLAAAGMAFIEGDPLTAGHLVGAPPPASAPASLPAPLPRPDLAEVIVGLARVAASAEQAAADLTGRQLARRAFSGVEIAIAAFRSVAVAHRRAADALALHVAVVEATDERRRVVEELLDGVAESEHEHAPEAGGGTHVARLLDKALAVRDERTTSEGRCVVALAAETPASAERDDAYRGIDRAVDAVCALLAEAAAGERGGPDAAATRADPDDRRTAA